MTKPTSAGTIALALDAKRGAFRYRRFRSRPPRTSPTALEAVLAELERQGAVRSEASRSLLLGTGLPGGGSLWLTEARWEEWRQREARRQAAADRAAADRAAADRARLGEAPRRPSSFVANDRREERDEGGSPVKRAVDETLAENKRMYNEYQRRRPGEGGAS
ncbi:hypothetical protein [Streptacidiphilus sp. BW17]